MEITEKWLEGKKPCRKGVEWFFSQRRNPFFIRSSFQFSPCGGKEEKRLKFINFYFLFFFCLSGQAEKLQKMPTRQGEGNERNN